MSIQFGSSESKQKGSQMVQMPAPSAEETELRKLNLELAKRQIQQYDQALAESQASANDPLVQQQRELERAATQNLLDRMTGKAPVISPEGDARLNTAYNAALERGQLDLRRAADEAAGMRGMSIADSPIGNEYLRQQQGLIRDLGATKAASSLDLGNTEANFQAQIAQFQNNLRQQALMNRLAMAGQAPASFGLQQSLFGERNAAAGRSFRGAGSGSNFGWGLSGSDLGRLAMGAGAMMG